MAEHEEPTPGGEGPDTYAPGESVWLRGLWMLLLLALFQLGQSVLFACTVLQFLWILFARQKNAAIAEFGASLAEWLRKTARFNAGATDEKPFPWTRWGH